MEYKHIPYEQGSPALKATYDEIKKSLQVKSLPNWVTFLGNQPHLLEGVMHLLKGFSKDAEISTFLQELIMF